MATGFWTSQQIREQLGETGVVIGGTRSRVQHCAYELSVGPEAAITGRGADGADVTKRLLEPGETLTIPPGQFAMVLTEEKVRIPADVIAFISIRAKIKFRGLVNVSGFHVDPGYTGRLKFSVYNAGPMHIRLQRGQPVFMIWFANLTTQTDDPYSKGSEDNDRITADDLMLLQGEVISPSALKAELHEQKHRVDNLVLVATVLVTSLFTFLVGPWAYDKWKDLTDGNSKTTASPVTQQPAVSDQPQQGGGPPSPTGADTSSASQPATKPQVQP